MTFNPIKLARRIYLIKAALKAKSRNEGFVYKDRFVRSFTENPDNPFIVSFPRTGSHWLRLLMELYFRRPSLVRAFYYPEKSDFLACHVHDHDLDVERRNVVYLYREPVATIFSQLSYHGENVDDVSRIVHWSDLYARHLDKWIFSETFTQHKTVLCYDRMREDLEREFSSLCAHFSEKLDRQRLRRVARTVSKGEVKNLTAHDHRVVPDRPDYDDARKTFAGKHAPLVWKTLRGRNSRLEPYLSGKADGGKANDVDDD
ncbi:hypothetical protein [Hoeflea poritis]|uniref:Sulfotransferase domain-containing protein n=1 Tax=Hoeflea poritis TaxID=2993659 RepID=A0ABT4VHS9_9HYPH|nr:hypothetical protein [Hoeflea poritis]MDA4844248.1 hypothetical protein [Hoeflea poritis]